MQEPPFYSQGTLFTNSDFQSEIYTWFADGVGVDFTGCSAALAFRVVPTDAAPLFTATTITLGTATLNPGQVSYTVARASSAGVTAPVVHGDLLITDSLGKVIQFAHVTLAIVQGSTY